MTAKSVVQLNDGASNLREIIEIRWKDSDDSGGAAAAAAAAAGGAL